MTVEEKAQNAALRFLFGVLGADSKTIRESELSAILAKLGFADCLEGTYLRHDQHSEMGRVTQFRRSKTGRLPTVTVRLSDGMTFYQAEIAFDGRRILISALEGSANILTACASNDTYSWVASWLSGRIRSRTRKTRTCNKPTLQAA